MSGEGMTNEADKANAALAAIRATPHNGRMYQDDDVQYMLELAVIAGNGLGAINPQWFRDQAKLIKGTLAEVARLTAENAALRAVAEAQGEPNGRD
jgi:hypothetical protein